MPAIDLNNLTIEQKTAIKSALGLNDTITAGDPATLTNKTLVNPVFSGAGATGQLELPAQKMSTDTSAVTRGALIAEMSENFLAPLVWRTPVSGGTTAPSIAESNGSCVQYAYGTGITTNPNSFTYVKCFNVPYMNRGAGANNRLQTSKFSLLFDINSNGIVAGEFEHRLLFGINATSDLSSLACTGTPYTGTFGTATGSFGVIWTSTTAGKLQFHNGSTLLETPFTLPVGGLQINSLNRWMITWDSNITRLTLYYKRRGLNQSSSSSENRWVQLAFITTPTLPDGFKGVGLDLVFGTVRTTQTGTNGSSPRIEIDSAYIAPYVITPNPL